jgi:hypothetical protein
MSTRGESSESAGAVAPNSCVGSADSTSSGKISCDPFLVIQFSQKRSVTSCVHAYCTESFATAMVPLFNIFFASVTQAQETIDVAKITCDQYLAGRVTDSRTLFVWLSGYYNGTRNDTVIDVSDLQKKAQTIMDDCLSHPDKILLEATKNNFSAKK